MVRACWSGGECPYLQRRPCLFGRSTGKVAAALLVGSEAPRDDVLGLAGEVQELRRVVQMLGGAVVWDPASLAATAVAKPVVEARPPDIAKDSASTESVFAVSPVEAGSPGSRAGGTTRIVEEPKISCQGKVEVVKNIPQERNSERMGKQSRVVGVPKISCQENVDKIMKSLDARRETRSRFLVRVCESFGHEVAIAVGEGVLSSTEVCDGFPS